jgi:hypothetical protein
MKIEIFHSNLQKMAFFADVRFWPGPPSPTSAPVRFWLIPLPLGADVLY